MHIALKKDGKIYINGAVIRVDRKVNIELLNEATFLLESNMIDADAANTPLKQIYYVLQSAMLRPGSSSSVNKVLRVMTDAIRHTNGSKNIPSIDEVTRLCAESRYFEALKVLRVLISDIEGIDKTQTLNRGIGVPT